MRVLISHRYFWPEDLSLYPLMLRDVAEWHAGRGHETTVCTAVASDESKRRERQRWAEDRGVVLREVVLPIDRGRSLPARLSSAARYSAHLWRAVSDLGADVVLTGTTPPILPGLVARLAKRRDCRLVYYVQDIAPEALGARGGWVRGIVARGLAAVDRVTVGEAAATITISHEMRRTLLNRASARGEVRVIKNYNVDEVKSRPPSGASELPRLVFAGNQGVLQNLHHFLDTIEIARREEDFEVVFVGDGSENASLRERVSRSGIERVTFLGQMPRAEAQACVRAADIGVVAAAPGLYRVAYPSKINSYLVAGLPVLVFAEEGSPVDRWLRRDGFGAAASPSDPHRAADALVGMVQRVRAGVYDSADIASRAGEQLSAERYFVEYGEVMSELERAA